MVLISAKTRDMFCLQASMTVNTINGLQTLQKVQYNWYLRKDPKESPQGLARTSAAGLNIPETEVGFSSCTQGPRRRPKAVRAAKDPVW